MKWVFIAFVILVLNSGYLAAFAEPNLFYMLNVLLHVVLGVALVIPFFIYVRRFLENDAPKGKELAIYMGRLGYWCLAPCVLTGLYLTAVNATHLHSWILYVHIAAGFAGAAFFQKSIRSVAHKVSTKNLYDVAGRVAWITVVIAIFVPILVGIYNLIVPRDSERISNPAMPLEGIEESARGSVNGPFAPSAISTVTQKNISSQSFLNSASCSRSRCHPDIYHQWQSSAHHYSSFNNPWYRKSVESLLENSQNARTDTNHHAARNNPAKWCAGCHDPALLVSGKLEQPLQELAKTAEAHAGISCTACHSIVQVKSTLGQADYVVKEMPLNDWATSDNKILQKLYDFLVRIDPEPHRRSMMKPFHRDDGAEFCSTCHKAHLDKPVNGYRWVRSFNDYDPWQAGPFSGRSSRSSYAAREAKSCVDCHMPLIKSKDAGNFRGKIRSHRFPGANTALPTVKQNHEQLEATIAFLRDNQVSVDIFAIGKPYSHVSTKDSIRKNTENSFAKERRLAPLLLGAPVRTPFTLFAVGDEQRFALGAGGSTRHSSEVVAPINRSNIAANRGEEVRIDVVVRSLNVGHFFPTGTVDAHEVWLELQAIDDRGQIIFWSGAVADAGKGQVDSSAHFYRSYLVDGEGNHLDKNNTWMAREAAYVNLIPPDGADVVRYRLKIPADCGDEIHFLAKLHYRKFSRTFTQWVFADFPQALALKSVFGLAAFAENEQNGHLETWPEIPIVEMARDSATIAIVNSEAEKPALSIKADPQDWNRWNSYGLGLLGQGDLENAESAFLRVAENAPNRAEAWINTGIVRLQKGNFEGARKAFETALKMDNTPFKINFYFGLTLRAQGEYDEALKYFKKAIAKFPRDRLAKIERGHLYLLMKDHQRAIADFEKVLSLDPENLEAYYYLIQAYRAVGEGEKAERAEMLYERFKAGDRQFLFDHNAPDAENIRRERQPIHEHFSTPLSFSTSAIPPATDRKTQSTK
jgi:tetratricopeptide (TPR) repeat protein